MATEKREQSKSETVGRVSGFMRLLELERAFIIFSIIYIPVAWLFLNRGYVEEGLLLIYTLILAIIGVIMVARFALFMADAANKHSGNYGSLLLRYLVDAFIPLVMFKVLGFVFMSILPMDRHRGLMCDLVRLLRHLYWETLKVQHSLDLIILVSAALVFGFAVWSIGHRSHNN